MNPAPPVSLDTLPHEIIMFIATTPQELCLLARTSKALAEISSDDRVWKPIFLRYRKYPYNKKEQVTWKSATMGINHARYAYASSFCYSGNNFVFSFHFLYTTFPPFTSISKMFSSIAFSSSPPFSLERNLTCSQN